MTRGIAKLNGRMQRTGLTKGSTHSTELHEARDTWRRTIEPVERVLPFCRYLVAQGLGGHRMPCMIQYTRPVDELNSTTRFSDCGHASRHVTKTIIHATTHDTRQRLPFVPHRHAHRFIRRCFVEKGIPPQFYISFHGQQKYGTQ